MERRHTKKVLEEMKLGEIYKVTNKITGEAYIGQAKLRCCNGQKNGMMARWKHHLRETRENIRQSCIFHQAIRKYS